MFVGYVGILMFPVAIGGLFVTVGLLTRFRPEQSTVSQRLWLLIWIPVNLFTSLYAVFYPTGVFNIYFNTLSWRFWVTYPFRYLACTIPLVCLMILCFWVFFEG